MAKKKPYWVRTLFKLKPRVRAMEEELKQQKQTPKSAPIVPPTKTWSFSWKIKIDWARAFLIFVLAYLIVWFFTNDVFLTITVTN